MKTLGLLAVLLILRFAASAQQPNFLSPKKINSFVLFSLSGETATLNIQKPSVFIFLSPECPLCKNSAAVLTALQQEYPLIDFYGIFPGKNGFSELADFKQQYRIRFKLFADPSKQLTTYLKATTTPQAFFINQNGQVLYNGLINNWPVSLGKQRQVITAHYLNNAIKQFLTGQTVKINQTTPIGCLINDI